MSGIVWAICKFFFSFVFLFYLLLLLLLTITTIYLGTIDLLKDSVGVLGGSGDKNRPK